MEKITGSIAALLLFTTAVFGQSLPRLYERNETYTHDSLIWAYGQLHERYRSTTKWRQLGTTDSGKPLYLFQMGSWGEEQATIFILNGIHPGEPCGIDASLHFAEELLKQGLPENVGIAIVPAYNLGGMLNRGCCSRANQNGPHAYGFRGNAQNLDLNRDFIKMDSRNARNLVRFFTRLKPDYFIDTHSTNGADYQYVLTLIPTQSDKLGGEAGKLLREELTPYLTEQITADGYLTGPYVNVYGRTPEAGFDAFLDGPRYSGGWAALSHTLAFTTEAHMWKPYADRVQATQAFMHHLTEYAAQNRERVNQALTNDRQNAQRSDMWPIDWTVDTTRSEMLEFQGYEAVYEPSPITGQDRLKYQRESLRTFPVKYRNRYVPLREVPVPYAYVIPQAWQPVVKRLQWLGARPKQVNRDSTVTVTAYYLRDVHTVPTPYEGHYYHDSVRLEKKQIEIALHPGDYLLFPAKTRARVAVELLEPEAPDSFFRWNFFDAVLQQKEWFSSYIWEDKAWELLQQDPDLKAEFEQAKQQDPNLQKSAFQQLYWIYQRSPNYEPTAFRYPVYRIEADGSGATGLR